MANGLSSLFENKLFLQYLAGAGQDISSGNAIGTNVNQITQQNIQTQNYAKLLQKMLGGEVPEGGKVTMDSKGLKMDVPTSALGTLGTTGATGNANTNLQPAVTPTPPSTTTQQNQGILSLLNPSSSPLGNLSPADLAGLTPETISSAVSLKQQQENQQQNQMLNLIKLSQSQQQLDLDQQQMNISAWEALNADERTAAIQNYEYAVRQGYEGDFASFQKDITTTHQKEYAQAKAEGYEGDFQSWLRDITALGGGLSLGEYRARKEIEDVQENKNYFAKDLSTDIDKYINSEDVQNELFQIEDISQRNLAKGKKVASYIEQQIVSKGATIEDVKRSGNTFTWTISWPDGSTQKVNRIIKLGSK